MKAILVIDVPSDYGDIADNKAIVTLRNGKLGTSLGIYNVPLKQMPEKNTWDITKNGHVTEYAEGWNACIEELG